MSQTLTTIEGLEIRNGDGADGTELKRFYQACGFDNGRSPDQYRRAFANSVSRLALIDGQIVAAARAISDGVRCAALFDVCVSPNHRGKGIGRSIVQSLLSAIPGQFVICHCGAELDSFYTSLGFRHATGAMVLDHQPRGFSTK
jgi:GNAT superfamily N-acetyltransferase